MQLYDLGYLEIKDFDLLVKVLMATDAVLVDARFSPSSRDPRWRESYLRDHLPDGSYVHMKAIGNEAYKTGGPFSFPDLESGMKAIDAMLKTRNVIVMCGCWNRQECHRLKVVKEFEHRYGITSTPLTLKTCKQIAKDITLPGESSQLSLF